MHGLTLIADSGGPMFRTFVDQSLYTVINLLLQTPPFMTEVHQCLGKCIGALITAIGPELQGKVDACFLIIRIFFEYNLDVKSTYKRSPIYLIKKHVLLTSSISLKTFFVLLNVFKLFCIQQICK